jgi:predicted DNA-binding transcriptional regulator YafY
VSKLERLLNLTALLLNTSRPLRVDEIGARMEGYPEDPASFRRTFERDKDELRELGIPIEVVVLDASDQKLVGYRIAADQYYLPPLDLEPDELASLRLALAAVRADSGVDDSMMRKLGGNTAETPPTLDEFAETPLAAVPLNGDLTSVFIAIRERRTISFFYKGTERCVEPSRLDYQSGRWYVGGVDVQKAAHRSFRLDRFESVPVLGAAGSFQPVIHAQGVRFEPWRFGDDEPVDTTVIVDATHAGAVRRQFPDALTRPDGSVELHLEVTNRRAFRSFLLGFLDHAEVVAPASVREEFVEWLEAAAR